MSNAQTSVKAPVTGALPAPVTKASATTTTPSAKAPAKAPTVAPTAAPTKGANWQPPTPEPTSTKAAPPTAGKAASLLTGPAKSANPASANQASGAASATTTGSTVPKAAMAKVPPTSAAAVVEENVKPISAMQRLEATGSVLARGTGAKAEAPAAPKAKAKAGAKAPAALASAGPAVPMGMVAPASVVQIVSSHRTPALEAGYPAMAGSAGPARTLAASASAKVAEVIAKVGSKATDMPAEGPAVVAVGRAMAAGACQPVKMEKGKLCAPFQRKFQVVFVTSEVAPFSKTGGLGEAMDGLPVALAALGHRVMVISPRYDQYAKAWDTSFEGSVTMGGKTEPVRFFHCYQQKVDLVFVDHPVFLERVDGLSGSKLYGPEWGKDFMDNQARFAYFCKAALIAIKDLPLGGFTYGDECVVVANDWHSALVPMFIAAGREKEPGSWAKTKTTLLVHNAVFQGRFPREEGLSDVLGVPQRYVDSITFKMPLKVGKYNEKITCVNTMAAGLRYADRVLTVSPSYAVECATDPEKGVELEELFAVGRVTGILNGVKEGVSPADKTFATKTMMACGTFTPMTADKAKAELKVAYRSESGLPASEGPMMCFIGRLDAQKGYDLLLEALVDVLEDTEMQVVIVGAGRTDLVQQTRAMEKKFPNKFFYAGWMGPERYSLLAGCDYTLLPSRWEPCGLVQMEAMRMGTLPIVAPTGGLKDTVEDGVNGLWTDSEMTVEAELDDASVASLAKSLRRAAELHLSSPAKCSEMRKAAMAAAAEFTWSNAALQYEALFEEIGAMDVIGRATERSVTLEVDRQVC